MADAASPQPNKPARSLSVRLLLLAVCILTPAVVLTGALIWRVALLDRVRADQESLQLARSVAGALDREIDGSIATLRALASSPALQTGDLAQFHQQASATLQFRSLHALLRKPDGQQILNTRRPFGTPLPKQDLRDAEREVLATGTPAVSELIVGGVTESWLLGLSVPVIMADEVRYILTMSIDPTFIAGILASTPRDPEWIIAVSDAKGRLIARSHEHDAMSGRIIHPDVKAWSPPPEGTHRTASLAGPMVLRGYHWSEKSGWMIAAFVPARVVEGPLRELWWRFVLSALGLTAVALPLTLLLGRRIAAPIEKAARDARRLGQGELVEPTTSSLVEANELSAALASASVEMRERTRVIADNEIRFRNLFEQSAVGFAQVALDGRMIGVNERLCKILGYTRDECLGKSFQVLTHPDDLPAEEELLAGLLRNEWPHYEIEKRVFTKSGEPIWVRVTSSFVRDEGGVALHRTSVIEDITERRRAREAAARLAATVLASHDAMISVCPTGNVETWNPAAENLFGYTAGEIVGKSLDLLVPPNRKHELRQKLDAAMAGQIAKVETVRLHKDGTPIDVSSTATAITADGRITAISVTMEDIRDRKRREAQILLLNRELAHRVKNTLAVIQSIANQTMQSTPDPNTFKQAFQGRLQSLAAANDLLLQTSWEGADFGDFIDRQLAPLMSQASRQLAKQGPRVLLPADLSIPLSLALHELGTNAIKYGAWSVPAGQVRIVWWIEPTADAYGAHLLLTWTEVDGPPIKTPTRRGFGTTIIERGIPNAKVERTYPPSGMVCKIDMVLTPYPRS